MKRFLACLLSLCLLCSCALAELPELPAGTLAAGDAGLPGGQTLSVYTGPGEQYLPDGDLTCDSDAPAYVLGTYERWMLVLFEVDDARLCVGWVKPDGVADYDTYTDMTVFEGIVNDGALREDTVLTDDPLRSGHAVTTVPAGTEVQLIGTLGDWQYVRLLNTEERLCGFLPTGSVLYTSMFASDAAVPLTISLEDGEYTAMAVNKALDNDYFDDPEAENANYTLEDALACGLDALRNQYGITPAELLSGCMEYGYRLNPDNDWPGGSYWQFDFCDPYDPVSLYEIILSDLDLSVLYTCGPGEAQG